MDKLTHKLEAEHLNVIRNMHAMGKKSEGIALYLKEKCGVNVSSSAVRYRIRIMEGQIPEIPEQLQEYIDKYNVDPAMVKQAWHKKAKLLDGSHLSVQLWPQKEIEKMEKLREDILALASKHAPVYPKIKRQAGKDGHLLVIDPADIHLGKLASAFETGSPYDSQIAVKRVKEGVQGILDKASGFNIDKILFIGGNDVLHIDSPSRKTTSGTPQDTDGMWYDNFKLAMQLYIEVLEMLITVAPVDFIFNPSNHDWTHGFFLCQTVEAWFKDNKDITFDTKMTHRKYYKYFSNLIGTTHGDGAKVTDLPALMAHEAKLLWATTNHHYWYTHHIHHKTMKDNIGVTIESMRSPSGDDGWHDRNGYVGAPKAIEGFLHHPQNGQVARITHLF